LRRRIRVPPCRRRCRAGTLGLGLLRLALAPAMSFPYTCPIGVPLCNILVHLHEVVVDDLLELLDGLGATQRAAFTKTSAFPARRPGAQATCPCRVASLCRPSSSAALNFSTSNPSSRRISRDRPGQGLLVGKQLVVHLPEFALLVRSHRRLRRQRRVGVERQRVCGGRKPAPGWGSPSSAAPPSG